MKKKITQFFSHPLVGVSGTVVSIGLALYLFLLGQTRRELTYYIYPNRAAVVSGAGASGLEVHFKGKAITSDVSAVQLAIWNKGDQSIRPGNVLEPVIVRLDPPCPILDVSVRKMSRTLVKFDTDKSHIDTGILPLSWEILEHNDGGVLQLIYAGPASARLTVEGVIEGQNHVSRMTLLDEPDVSKPARFSRTETKLISILFLVAGLTMCAKGIFDAIRPKSNTESKATLVVQKQAWPFFSILFGCVVGLAGFFMWRVMSTLPPFVF